MREALVRPARLVALALCAWFAAAPAAVQAGEGSSEGTPVRSPYEERPPGAPTTPREPGASPPGDAVPIGAGASMIGGPSLCPRPDAVWAELGTLVPRDRLDARLRAVAGGGGPVVQIFDLGVPYRIVAAGRVREYRDETHDCGYRARIAAVFVALSIDPAELSMEPPAPPRAPELAPATPPPLPRPVARLELAAAGQLGVGSGQVSAQGGLALRATVGRDRLALVVGTELLAPSDVTLGGVDLRQWRLPVDVGVRAMIDGSRLQPYGELGLELALLSERALALANPNGATSLEVGVRVGAGVRLATRGRLAPFIAVDGELVPSPPQVFALPRGVLGHTPLLWLGAAVGASLGFL